MELWDRQRDGFDPGRSAVEAPVGTPQSVPKDEEDQEWTPHKPFAFQPYQIRDFIMVWGYLAKCRHCQQPIRAGDEIKWIIRRGKGHGLVHTACQGSAPAGVQAPSKYQQRSSPDPRRRRRAPAQKRRKRSFRHPWQRAIKAKLHGLERQLRAHRREFDRLMTDLEVASRYGLSDAEGGTAMLQKEIARLNERIEEDQCHLRNLQVLVSLDYAPSPTLARIRKVRSSLDLVRNMLPAELEEVAGRRAQKEAHLAQVERLMQNPTEDHPERRDLAGEWAALRQEVQRLRDDERELSTLLRPVHGEGRPARNHAGAAQEELSTLEKQLGDETQAFREQARLDWNQAEATALQAAEQLHQALEELRCVRLTVLLRDKELTAAGFNPTDMAAVFRLDTIRASINDLAALLAEVERSGEAAGDGSFTGL